jgi:hypothetical protein
MMISRLGKLGVCIAALAGTTVLGTTPALANSAPVCQEMLIGPIPGYANSQITVSEMMVVHNCTDPDGDTMHVTSPTVPYTIYVYPNGQDVYSSNTVSDGKGGLTTQTIHVWRN